MKVLFYILALIGAAPVGIYASMKYPLKNQFLKILQKVFLFFSLFIQLMIAIIFIIEGHFIAVPIFYLILNFLSYWLYTDVFIKQYDLQKYIKEYYPENDKKTNNQNNLDDDYVDDDIQLITLDIIEEHLNTGEILEFHYLREDAIEPQRKRIIVESIYSKNNYVYINGFDVDIEEDRTYRYDRML